MIDLTSWGYTDLDSIVGPLVPGRLYVVGAKPGNGKSTLLLNVLNAIYATIRSKPRRVFGWFAEMGPEVTYRVWAALRCGLDADKALMGALQHEDQMHLNAIEPLLRNETETGPRGAWIRLGHLGHPNWSQIKSTLSQHLKDGEAPAIVLFDHMQRVRAKTSDRFSAIAEAALGFQTLAQECNCAVVVSSQLKRGQQTDPLAKYRVPSQEDFKLAGEIEEAADVALGVFRLLKPGFTRKDEADVRSGQRGADEFAVPNTMAVRVLKHRYRGPASDRLLRLSIDGSRVLDRFARQDPIDRGDAYEGPG